MEFTYAVPVTRDAVVSYTAFSPLPNYLSYDRHVSMYRAVIFCCTGPGVTSARRYLAFCPMKPGLSSRAMRQRSLVPLKISLIILYIVVCLFSFFKACLSTCNRSLCNTCTCFSYILCEVFSRIKCNIGNLTCCCLCIL